MFGGLGLGSLVIGVWKVVLAQGFRVEWNASAGCTYYGGLNSSNRVLDATIMFLRKHQKSSSCSCSCADCRALFGRVQNCD